MAAPVQGMFETCRDFWGAGGGLLGCCVEDIWAEEDEGSPALKQCAKALEMRRESY